MAEEVMARRPRPRLRQIKRAVGLVAATVALLWAIAPLGAQTGTGQVEPVEIRMYNAHESLAPTLSWANVIQTIPGSPRISQTARGDAEGKRQLIEGRADAVVSGTPFSDTELAELDATGRGVIAAPVQAVGMTVFASGPKPFGIDLCTLVEQPEDEDPGNELPPDCLRVRDFEGPLRLSSKDVADVFLDYGANNWRNVGFQNQFLALDPVNTLHMNSPLQGAAAVLRSDAGMANLALGEYIHTLQPAKWASKAAGLSLDPAPEPADAWPFVAAPMKGTMPDAVGIVRQWKTASAATDVPAENGAMTLTTSLAALQAMQAELEEPPTDAVGDPNPKTDLYVAQLQNGAGEWVTLSPESITTALAAEKGASPYDPTDTTPGAWPLSWANSLYVPDSGLTGDEANAIAAVIRWQSTVGRDHAAELGDGQLPESMVQQALDAADEIVRSNCTAAGLDTITTSDPRRFAPPDTLSDLGDTVWCDTPVDVQATTTTTTPSTATTSPFVAATTQSGSGSSGGTSSGGASGSSGSSSGRPLSASGGSSSPSGASADGTATSDGGGGYVEGPMTAAKITRTMPLEMPGKIGSFDRVATLIMGGLLFLAVRGLGRWMGLVSR